MPNLDYVRQEIEYMRAQVGRQRKEILQLQRAGICTASAELLLGRMHAKIDDLCAERDRLKKVQAAERRVLGRRSLVTAAALVEKAADFKSQVDDRVRPPT